MKIEGGEVLLTEGELIGKMALLDQRWRQHDVTACMRCRQLMLDQNEFEFLRHQ